MVRRSGPREFSHSRRWTWMRRAGGAASLAGLLFSSSCAANRDLAHRKMHQPQIAKTTPVPRENAAPAAALPSYADKLAAAKEATHAEGVATPHIEHAVINGSPLMASVEQLSYETVSADAGTNADSKAAAGPRPWAEDLNAAPDLPEFNDAAIAAAVYYPAEPRIALTQVQCPSPVCRPPAAAACAAACPQETGADEYICDGGDRGQPVHYESGRMAGLETEDTVVEFRDELGQRKVQESNQVCVYAPRFGVARTVTEAVGDYRVDKVAGTHDGLLASGISHEMRTDEKRDVAAIVDQRSRERLSGLASSQTDGVIDKDVAALTRAKLVNAFQDTAFLRTGVYDTSDVALLQKLVNAAGEWSYQAGPRVVAEDIGGQSLTALFVAEEAVAVEDPRGPGQLRIVKLADRDAASPGDLVTFSIRIDNLGDRELREIRVFDSLSPRLELVESSVKAEQPGVGPLDGELILSEGETGGQVLEFLLTEALQGKTGAVISFQCRVR